MAVIPAPPAPSVLASLGGLFGAQQAEIQALGQAPCGPLGSIGSFFGSSLGGIGKRQRLDVSEATVDMPKTFYQSLKAEITEWLKIEI